VPAAWASVAHIESSHLGHFLRGLHAQGATFLLGVAALHLLQTALYGAYRAPREITWWLGLVLLGLLLAFCLTGSLLPWDERGYWATRVTMGIAGTAPLIGGALTRVLAGGHEFGNLTLTRFYAVHAMLLPLLLLAFGVAHVAGMRRHGVTAPPKADPRIDEAFWPRQALYDAAFALLLLAALSYAGSRGAPLGAPADPGGAANPRPEWYFRPLFQLLKLTPGALESVAAFGVPLLAAVFLFALPFIDRKARARKPVLAALAGGFLAAAGLCIASYRADAKDPQFARGEALARGRAQKAMKLARTLGVPPDGALALLMNQPDERGARLFARACIECHSARGTGGEKAPRLDGIFSRQWIRSVLLHPEAPENYGNARISGMEGYEKLGADKIARLTEYLYALRSHAADDPALESGRRLFTAEGCAECHALQKGADSGGPTLAGYASADWLRGLLRDPGAPGYYAGQNRMPDFGNRLHPDDISDLVAFVASLEADLAVAQGEEP
jgi:ubiquinol-cytochrome c reductase cytochrome b subunit